MRKLLFLLWLPSVAFSAVMSTFPDTADRFVHFVPNYVGQPSWYSLWLDSLITPKTNELGTTNQDAVTTNQSAIITNRNVVALSETAFTNTSAASLSNAALAAYDPPAAIAANPEPGTWGLLMLGLITGLIALYRRRPAR